MQLLAVARLPSPRRKASPVLDTGLGSRRFSGDRSHWIPAFPEMTIWEPLRVVIRMVVMGRVRRHPVTDFRRRHKAIVDQEFFEA